jgi:phage head maturation protease
VKRITGLYDVAIVTHPAYEQTEVALRELSVRVNAAIDEQIQRESGSAAEKQKAEERLQREQQEAEERLQREQREAEQREAVRTMQRKRVERYSQEIFN